MAAAAEKVDPCSTAKATKAVVARHAPNLQIGTIAHSSRVYEVEGVVAGIGIGVVGLGVANGAAETVRGEETAKTGRIEAGEGVVKSSFGVALVTGEFVAGRAGGGLQARGERNLPAVRSEVGVITELAGSLTGAAAGADGASGTELVSEVVKDVTGAVAGSDAAASKEDIFILRGAGAVGFGEGVAGEGAPGCSCLHRQSVILDAF